MSNDAPKSDRRKRSIRQAPAEDVAAPPEQALVDQLSRRHQDIEARRQRWAAEQIRREAQMAEQVLQVSIESLYMPRVLRKLPREFSPLAWRALEDEYEHRRCDYEGRPFGQNYLTVEREAHWPELDLREIRRIVFGWTTHPPLESFFSYDDQFDRVGRERVQQALRDLPDSPIAIAQMLRTYEPLATVLEGLEGFSKRESIGWLATKEELAVISRLDKRGSGLRDEIRDAKESLSRMDLQIGTDYRLRSLPGPAGGRPADYLNVVIRGLYLYLKPIFDGAFKNDEDNPEELREQVRRLLEPYFDPADLSAGYKKRIWQQFNNAANRESRADSRPGLKSRSSGSEGADQEV